MADEPEMPEGVTPELLMGGPAIKAGITNTVPIVPPPGCSFTYWTPNPGLPHTLYLIYPVEQEGVVLDWSLGFAAILENAIRAQRYMRKRYAEKAAADAARPSQLPPHRVHRSVFRSQPGASPQVQPPTGAPTMATPMPMAPSHGGHPSTPVVPQAVLNSEAEVARARIRGAEARSQATLMMARFASFPEGRAELRRILEQAESVAATPVTSAPERPVTPPTSNGNGSEPERSS